MNKALEQLMEWASGWPEEAQKEAVRVLSAIEEKHVHGDAETSIISDRDIEAVRSEIQRSLIDPRPDKTLEQSFGRVERLHAERLKAR